MTGRIQKTGLCVPRKGQVQLARSKAQDVFQSPGDENEPEECDVPALLCGVSPVPASSGKTDRALDADLSAI